MKDIQSDMIGMNAEREESRQASSRERMALREKYAAIVKDAAANKDAFLRKRQELEAKRRSELAAKRPKPGFQAVMAGLRDKVSDAGGERYAGLVALWEAAEAGNVEAIRKMADVLLEGAFKVPDAEDEALRFLLLAADAGDGAGAMKAAEVFEKRAANEDCATNLRRALDCYRLAGAAGIAEAYEIAKVIESELDEAYGAADSSDPVARARARSRERRDQRDTGRPQEGLADVPAKEAPTLASDVVGSHDELHEQFHGSRSPDEASGGRVAESRGDPTPDESLDELMTLFSLSGTWESPNQHMMEVSGDWPTYAAEIHTPTGVMSGRIVARPIHELDPSANQMEEFLRCVEYRYTGRWQLGTMEFVFTRPDLEILEFSVSDMIAGSLADELPELVGGIVDVVDRQNRQIRLTRVLKG